MRDITELYDEHETTIQTHLEEILSESQNIMEMMHEHFDPDNSINERALLSFADNIKLRTRFVLQILNDADKQIKEEIRKEVDILCSDEQVKAAHRKQKATHA